MRWVGHIMHKVKKKGACSILVGSQEGRTHWKDLDVDGRTLERYDIDWIDLTQDRDQWRAFVNTAMSLRISQNVRKSLRS
jgi:hypothetical protein